MVAKLEQVRDEFITEWGALGSAWGVNRTMAQIHAYLMSCPEAQTTDEIMESLEISRGNAHSNIKELISWGMIKKVLKKGERKEFFLAEKDPWKIFCLVAKERKKREVEPIIGILNNCIADLKGVKGKEADDFQKQLKDLTEFVEMGDRVMEKISRSEKNILFKWLLKIL
ncbi:MAG: transcriptional regulator [Planctomycetota bacterium]|nr:MAG: transcriptional regulator [Planctomycetota bacterium]